MRVARPFSMTKQFRNYEPFEHIQPLGTPYVNIEMSGKNNCIRAAETLGHRS